MAEKRTSERDVKAAVPIRLILSDVDGVLTDGAIVVDNAGIESKSFHVRDGLAIKLWQSSGFSFGLLSSRNSQIVKLRAAELGIKLVRQGHAEKLPIAREIFSELQVEPEQVCYIGDDLPDLPVLNVVGLPVAVADAADEVRQAARWVTKLPGGRGAVRELVERVMKAKGCWENVLPVGPVG